MDKIKKQSRNTGKYSNTILRFFGFIIVSLLFVGALHALAVLSFAAFLHFGSSKVSLGETIQAPIVSQIDKGKRLYAVNSTFTDIAEEAFYQLNNDIVTDLLSVEPTTLWRGCGENDAEGREIECYSWASSASADALDGEILRDLDDDASSEAQDLLNKSNDDKALCTILRRVQRSAADDPDNRYFTYAAATICVNEDHNTLSYTRWSR